MKIYPTILILIFPRETFSIISLVALFISLKIKLIRLNDRVLFKIVGPSIIIIEVEEFAYAFNFSFVQKWTQISSNLRDNWVIKYQTQCTRYHKEYIQTCLLTTILYKQQINLQFCNTWFDLKCSKLSKFIIKLLDISQWHSSVYMNLQNVFKIQFSHILLLSMNLNCNQCIQNLLKNMSKLQPYYPNLKLVLLKYNNIIIKKNVF